MKRRVIGVLFAALILAGAIASGVQAQNIATWDGGDFPWESEHWNGGQTAATVFGDNRVSNGYHIITIGDASQVLYDAGPLRDFRPRSNTGPTSLTIKDGASLTLRSVDSDVDGVWTQFDADLTLDNGTFRRTKGGTSLSGGLHMFGSWRSVENQQIDVLLTNGGRIENDGQIWFGGHQEHALGLKVFMTINDGSLDLTGGAYPQDNDGIPIVADLAFFYGHDFDAGECNGCTASGDPKGEEYKINFKGPGTITVDESGIWIYDQSDAAGGFTWSGALSTYENLWDRGILRSDGVSGGPGGVNFANHFTTTGSAGADDYVLTRTNPVAVVWDGGNGNWEDAKWNGGQTAVDTMGNNRGSDGGRAISIGDGAQVSYNAGTLRDFRPRIDNGPTSLTIKEGASLTMSSIDSDVDGVWTQFDADLTLDNGTYSRTKGGTSLSGGLMMLGSWRSRPGQEIDVNIVNGGRFENDGQLWFGAHQEHAPGLKVSMTIDDGSLDLTGGDYPQDNDGIPIVADLAFFYGRDFDAGECNGCDASGELKGEQYAINFTGPGSITVDESGIWLWDQDESFVWNGALSTYQNLWDRGILQANGQSGVTGATFGDFFSVMGTAGADDYMLTSLLAPPGLLGDFDGNGSVGNSDLTLLLNNWGDAVPPVPEGWTGTQPTPDAIGNDELTALLNTWGDTLLGSGAALGAGAVPEPSTVLLVLGAVVGLIAGRRRSA